AECGGVVAIGDVAAAEGIAAGAADGIAAAECVAAAADDAVARAERTRFAVAADGVAPAARAGVGAARDVAVAERAALGTAGVVAVAVGAGIGPGGAVRVAVLAAQGAQERIGALFPGVGRGVVGPAARAGRIGLGRHRDDQAEREGQRDKLEGAGDGGVLHGLSPCWMNVIHLSGVLR